MIIRYLTIAAALLAGAPAAAATYAITGGRVITNTGAPLEKADVVIRDGVVAAVGAGIAIPADAERIDATGKWVTPGLYAAFSRVGLTEIGAEEGSNDIGTEGDEALTAALDAAPAFNPAVSAIATSRAGGVTRAMTIPGGGAGMFSGRGALVRLDGAADSLTKARAVMLLDLGERGAGRSAGTRAALWPMLEAALDDALSYPTRYRSGQGGAVLGELDAQALQPFAQGQGLLLIAADRAADLLQVIELKRRRPALKLAIIGAAEGWRVAPQLARANLPVIVDPLRNLPDSFERVGARFDNAALLSKAGVNVSIGPMPGSDDTHQLRLITQYAGNAVANGLPWDAAFLAISRGPAEIYGQNDLGRLAPGARADVVIWSGDPLEVSSDAERVFIDGAPTSVDSTRQQALLERYKAIVLPRAQ